MASRLIKEYALKLGFQNCGISKIRELKEDKIHLQDWLKNGMNGEMHYMKNYFDKRVDPSKLMENAKSVISLSYNYYTNKTFKNKAYLISKYAYGKDYHYVIKNKLKLLITYIEKITDTNNSRAFVDSAPVLERSWAKQSGLGWIGKNANLISKKYGSFFFLSEILVNVELEYDKPIKDYCGNCTKCIDACPTGAIYEPYKINGSKCISYLTIELKNEIPENFKGNYKNWIFGCDICQDVCPWNKKSKQHNEPDFEPHPNLLKMTKKEWEEITEEKYRELFKKSAIKRAKYKGLKRNINFLQK
ncbi:MAG: tRNA epoxyqueuosine(34) reductase QueG [Chlorobi bacterium]|nr:tRNA epoxyqueuosine(34) reductase QueG [Chlorobiota bacterium]